MKVCLFFLHKKCIGMEFMLLNHPMFMYLDRAGENKIHLRILREVKAFSLHRVQYHWGPRQKKIII